MQYWELILELSKPLHPSCFTTEPFKMPITILFRPSGQLFETWLPIIIIPYAFCLSGHLGCHRINLFTINYYKKVGKTLHRSRIPVKCAWQIYRLFLFSYKKQSSITFLTFRIQTNRNTSTYWHTHTIYLSLSLSYTLTHTDKHSPSNLLK